MAIQTTRDSRYDYYNTGELVPNWSWYFRRFPDEKIATTRWLGLGLEASTLACIHYRLGDLKPIQQIVINEYKGARKEGRSDPSTFKVGTLLTPDLYAKVNWGRRFSSAPLVPQDLKGVVTELAKNSFDDIQITLLHEIGLKRYLIPNLMCLRFISTISISRGPSELFLFSFPF